MLSECAAGDFVRKPLAGSLPVPQLALLTPLSALNETVFTLHSLLLVCYFGCAITELLQLYLAV